MFGTKNEIPFEQKLKRILIGCVAVYIGLVIAFYFLAGEELRIRDSRGDIAMLTANDATVELSQGSTVEQSFISNIQILDGISIQWGSYYRENRGTAHITLQDADSGEIIQETDVSMSGIQEGQITDFPLEQGREGFYQRKLIIRITSPDAQAGFAITPLMCKDQTITDGELFLNGNPAEGALCFTAYGRDYIWTGLHYWQFAAIGGVLLLFAAFVVWHKYKRGKHSYVINAIHAGHKYRFLIDQLVARDFKAKYKRSILGVFWSFLNPLLTMAVQYVVFSSLFRFDVPNYPVYLLIGIVLFNFFTESCGMGLGSIVGNAHLITKVYMPKYIYPLTRTLSSLVNLLLALIPLLGVVLLSGLPITKAFILSLFAVLCLVVFSLGISLFLSTSMVFFRDTQFLWGVLSMIWMYLTPIFYPESILPPGVDVVLELNPLYFFIKFMRICLMDGVSPEPTLYVQCFVSAFSMLMIGSFVFKKNQDKFVLYL